MSSTTPEETDPASRTVETGPSGRSLMSSIGRVAGASTVALLFCELVSLAQTVALARLLTPAEIGIFVAGTVLTTFFGTFVEGGLRSGSSSATPTSPTRPKPSSA